MDCHTYLITPITTKATHAQPSHSPSSHTSHLRGALLSRNQRPRPHRQRRRQKQYPHLQIGCRQRPSPSCIRLISRTSRRFTRTRGTWEPAAITDRWLLLAPPADPRLTHPPALSGRHHVGHRQRRRARFGIPLTVNTLFTLSPSLHRPPRSCAGHCHLLSHAPAHAHLPGDHAPGRVSLPQCRG